MINDLQLCNNVYIPRGIILGYNKPIHKVELHGFSYASERAYAAVVYAKIQYESGEIDIRFVSSKSKVAPIRKQSIPRLELLGACLLSDLVNTIRKILNEELKGTVTDPEGGAGRAMAPPQTIRIQHAKISENKVNTKYSVCFT